jgi:oligopeptide transport system substrate-binding protein
MPSRMVDHRTYVRRMRLRRRQLLKAAAAGGAAGVAAFLAACTSAPPPAPTAAAPAAAPAKPTEPAKAAAAEPTKPSAAPAAAAPTAAPSPTSAPAPAAPSPTAAAAPTAAAKPEAAAVPAPSMAGALHLSLTTEPDTIDPGRASFLEEIEVIMRVFSNSYTFDSNAKLIPDQAEAAPQLSPDGKTITVKLKKGLTWSDGKPLTAKEFVYGARRQLNPVVAGDYAFTLHPLVGAEKYNTADPKAVSAADLQKLREAVGVAAPDDTTIVYTLAEPAPWFLSVLATWNGLPVREDLITAGGKSEDSQDWVKPATYIGNGPYVMAKHDAGVQFVFEANTRYARGAPPLKNVQHLMIKDNTVAFAAYKAGNLDRVTVSALIKPAVDADAALKQQFQLVPGTATYYIGLNTSLPPFDKVKVRQAFAASIDRKTFVDGVLKGLGLPAEQFVPPKFPGRYEDIQLQKFDPAAAKRLLTEAGYPDGKGLPPIKATFSSTDTGKLVMGASQAMFKQFMGVDVQLDPIEPKAFSALVKKPETTPQLFLLGWFQDYPDPQNWYSTVFHSSSSISHTSWKNDEFDRLCKAADVELDPKKRDEAYMKAAGILNTDAPVVFVYHSVTALLIKPEVQGLKVDPFEYFVGQHSLYDLKLSR